MGILRYYVALEIHEVLCDKNFVIFSRLNRVSGSVDPSFASFNC